MKKLFSSVVDWLKIVVLAAFLALFFKSCFFDVYTIPTTSMVSSLMPGDVIVVNKLRFGPKLVRTPLSIPFLHKYIPYSSGTKSFVESISLPYFRFPGYAEIERNDLLVFHYPMDDLFPVDHRTFYVKRCLALPGEKIEIKEDIIYINDLAIEENVDLSYTYRIISEENLYDLTDSLNITEGGSVGEEHIWEFTLDQKNKAFLSNKVGLENVKMIQVDKEFKDENMFAPSTDIAWNISQYGPIQVPKEDDTIYLNASNIKLYERMISLYEGHQLSVSPEGEIFIDKELRNYYVPEMNYYFMLGDNRHNSSDSRFWGFLPEDHIQGRASLVLYSVKPYGNKAGSLNWNRLVKTLK